jgi:uncharacterized protein YggL (DUF469 family)
MIYPKKILMMKKRRKERKMVLDHFQLKLMFELDH